MKRLMLVGDSIRLGYQPTVQKILQGEIEVWGPPHWEDGRGWTSRQILNSLSGWLDSYQPDRVHINCGLHDLAGQLDRSRHQIEVDEYKQNLTQIMDLLTNKPDRQIIWATTTPVDKEKQVTSHPDRPWCRYEDDVTLYNTLAVKIVKSFNLPINDLYQTAHDADLDQIMLPDGVHFTSDGYEMFGQAVVQSIKCVAS